MNRWLLLDVAPDPVHVVGWGALILIAIVVFVFIFALMIGFVILLKRRRRRAGPGFEATGATQPSSPNQ